jgi:hypothetical protein
MSDDDFQAGEQLALEWLEGRSDMSDDLALLVSGMSQPLDGRARAFLVAVGKAAQAAAKREGPPASSEAPATLRHEAPTPAAPPAPAAGVEDFLRLARERAERARIEELWRANSAIPILQRLD